MRMSFMLAKKSRVFLKSSLSKSIINANLRVYAPESFVAVTLPNRSKELNYSLTPFTGRSDYGPFIEKGVDIPGMLKTVFLSSSLQSPGVAVLVCCQQCCSP